MASQAQLEADIALARAQVASLELQLDAAAGSPQPDPAVIADIERQLATARNTLIQLQNELNNLLVASDTNTNAGVEAQLPQTQQTIDPNTDPNTNIGSEPVVENATPQFATGQNAAADAAFQEANASEQQVIDPNSDPNTNIGNDSQEQPPQPQQTISSASDPNTNIGTEGQIAPQKVPDEFDGIDAQVAANKAQADLDAQDAAIGGGGNTGALAKTRGDATNQDAKSFEKAKDWRVRLSLAPNAKYLYKADNPGILKPLQATNGVIFPYTPTVSAVYAANYDASELVHSNYKIYNYKICN